MKGISPMLEMNSNELLKKAKISIKDCGIFNLGFVHLSQPDINLDVVSELFRLGLRFEKLLCPACNGIHYCFTNRDDIKPEDTCLCHECANILALMVYLKIPQNEVKDWLCSCGKINPLEILERRFLGD